MNCDCSQILQEFNNVQLCTGLAHVIQLAHVPGHHVGHASRMVDGQLEHVGLFMHWIDSISLEQAAKHQIWRDAQAHVCIKALVQGVLAIQNVFLVH